MKKLINYTMVLCCIGILIACTKDFIEKDIKKDLVNIIAPVDNLKTPNNSVTFWWDELEGAEKYNLQIVKPSFDSIIQLMVDTTLTDTKFIYVFTPGKYQWRIKAINGGGSTAYTTRTLIIDTTSNLNYLMVNINTPANYMVTNTKTINFSWNNLGPATSYNLKVYLNSASSTPIIDYNTSNLYYSYTFTNAGVYFWKINASNAFSNSPYTTPISFKIDQTAPTAPNLSRPLNSASPVKDTSYFRWNYAPTGSKDIEYDSLYIGIYPDSVFTTPYNGGILVQRNSASSNSYEIKQLFSSPTNTLTASPYYYWKVKSVDSVGNVSGASATFKFKLMN